MGEITFMQYNMGSSLADLQLKYSQDEINNNKIDKNLYTDVAEKRNQGLLAMADKIDVFFFQEMLNAPKNNELLNKLRLKGFTVVHASIKNPDCIIAFKTNAFDFKKIVDDYSFEWNNIDFAVIWPTHKATGIPLLLASGHITGFKFEEKQDNVKEVAKNGDEECDHLIGLLSPSTHITIIGCDLNAQRDVYGARHEKFKKGKYTDYTTTTHTAEYRCDDFKQERHLDYFLVRNLPGLIQKIKSIFCAMIHFEFAIQKPEQLDEKFGKDRWNWFDRNVNSSDHMPIVATLQITNQNSLIYDGIMKVCRFVKSILPF